MKTSNIVLLALGLFLLAFVVVMVVTFWFKGSVPDTLIEYVLDGSKLEALVLAAITIIKVITGKKTGEREEHADH